MTLPHLPYNSLTSPAPVTDLDDTFTQLGYYVIVPCTATGTNTIALTPTSGTPSITALSNYMIFTFQAANTTTGSVTINVAGQGNLNAYLPDGLTQAGNGTFVANQLYGVMYSTAINSGAGGFIAAFPVVPNSYAVTITLTSISGNISVNNMNSGQGASAKTVFAGDGSWHPKGYVISSYTPGIQTTASQRFIRHTAGIPFTLTASLTSAAATSDTSALSAAVYTIKNAVAATPNSFSSCGTITFASGAQTGTFAFANSISFVKGDVLAVDGPAVANSTLTGLSITIYGTQDI